MDFLSRARWNVDTSLSAITVAGFLLAVYPLATCIYNRYFHPLAKYPGPALWAASRLPYLRSLLSGNLVHDTQRFHTKYGEIVRLAPDELSFARNQAYHDIYGGRPPFPKDPIWWKEDGRWSDGLLTAGPEAHSRMRKLLNHGFTERALGAQEHMVHFYVDLLISRLRDLTVASGKHEAKVNIVEWYNFTTFDITGDLAFAESFNCLENSKFDAWVSLIFNTFKAFAWMGSIRFYPVVEAIIKWCIPVSTRKMLDEHRQFAADKTHRRLNMEVSRPDLMSYVLKHNDEKGMTIGEIESTFFFLILAGSETTGTTLSGITSYLVRDPSKLKILTREIRSTFAKEEDITLTALKDLPYLGAVVEEGLRISPAVPSGVLRVVPKGGGSVCGERLAEDTHVSVHTWTINLSPKNFASPTAFIPERWLPEGQKPGSPFAYDRRSEILPFSTGPRSCIGKHLANAEIKLVLARMVWALDMELAEESVGFKWEELKTWLLVEKKPLFVTLKQRT